jgi:S1-C subfamily serine protease
MRLRTDRSRRQDVEAAESEGALVEGVNPNSAASTAGLRAKMSSWSSTASGCGARHLTRLVAETPVGATILAVVRDGKKNEMHIKPEAGTWFNPH